MYFICMICSYVYVLLYIYRDLDFTHQALPKKHSHYKRVKSIQRLIFYQLKDTDCIHSIITIMVGMKAGTEIMTSLERGSWVDNDKYVCYSASPVLE